MRSSLLLFMLLSVVCVLSPSATAADFVRGDCNADGIFDVADVSWMILNSINDGIPACVDACDADDDGRLNIADGVYALNFLFLEGPVIPAPYPLCGPDPTDDDDHECASYDCSPSDRLADDRFAMRLPDTMAGTGGQVDVPILLDIEQVEQYGPVVNGWSVGVCHDPSVVRLDDVRPGEAVAQVRPDFGVAFEEHEKHAGGWTAAVLIDYWWVDVLLPGQGYELAVARYDVVGDLGAATELTFCDTLGDPPVITSVVYWYTSSALPVQETATIEIVQGFLRSDTNADSTTDIADAVFTLNYLFGGGATPSCLNTTDVNDDGTVDLGDAVYLLSYLFDDGPDPEPPFVRCGTDPTPDYPSLGCGHYQHCP